MLTSLLFASVLAAAPSDSIIKRGASLGNQPGVSLTKVLAEPAGYAASKTPILIEGVVVRSCTARGCWMQVAPAAGQAGIRVTMKDDSFFIPLNSKGMKVRAIGTLVTKQHTKESGDRVEGEGGYLARNSDGTATEVTFVADGVELRS